MLRIKETIAIAGIALALATGSASAGPRLTGNVVKDLGLTGNPVEDVKTTIENVSTKLLQSIYDKLHKDGTAAIADANKALNVANQKLADGTTADPANASCLQALIPVMQIIVNNASASAPAAPASAPTPTAAPGDVEAAITAGTVDGPITVFAKIRVMISALQSPSVSKGCAELQVQTGNTGLTGTANLFAGFLGIKNLAPLAPAALTALGL